MKVKICGITNEDDAHAAIEAGAHALGFIFADASPRCVAPGDVYNIIKTLPPFVTTVGVFVNSSREKVLRTIQATGIQAMQFHGDESPEELQGYLLPTYKAFRVDERFDVTSLQQYQSKIFLLDTFVDGVRGGTGKTFNWSIAIEAKRFGRVVLSGGLRPDNIAEAVRTVQPYAIDVNSGVESSPGKKDKQKLKDLFSALCTTQEFAC